MGLAEASGVEPGVDALVPILHQGRETEVVDEMRVHREAQARERERAEQASGERVLRPLAVQVGLQGRPSRQRNGGERKQELLRLDGIVYATPVDQVALQPRILGRPLPQIGTDDVVRQPLENVPLVARQTGDQAVLPDMLREAEVEVVRPVGPVVAKQDLHEGAGLVHGTVDVTLERGVHDDAPVGSIVFTTFVGQGRRTSHGGIRDIHTRDLRTADDGEVSGVMQNDSSMTECGEQCDSHMA